MSPFDALLLGLVQGLTEFLPVSSSGHLALAEKLLGLRGDDLAFVVFVHFGTMLATMTAFWPQVWGMLRSGGLFVMRKNHPGDPHLKMLGLVLLGTVPAALVGLLLEESVERIFSSPILVSIMLLITGLILWLTHYFRSGGRSLGIRESILVGCAQALAILPGISRSGATISAGLYQKVDRDQAVEFSFLLALPAILGATILKGVDLLKAPPSSRAIMTLCIGTIAAYISGYVAIKVLLSIVRKGKLRYFALYCWAVGLIGLLFSI
ncbi:undecaprenyl-diphosphate phosphatase [Candidatus Zixiibacteriota bacterium]